MFVKRIKTQNIFSRRGYYHVTTIPKGATNIKIHHKSNHSLVPNDTSGNYLALSDSNDQHILNGHARLAPKQTNITYGGVDFHYTGYNNGKQRSLWSISDDVDINKLSTKYLEH